MYSSCVTKRNLFFLLCVCVCVRPLCQPRVLQGCQTWQHYFNKKYKEILERKKKHICLERRGRSPADWAHLLMCSSYKNSKSLEICSEKSQLDEIYTSAASYGKPMSEAILSMKRVYTSFYSLSKLHLYVRYKINKTAKITFHFLLGKRSTDF